VYVCGCFAKGENNKKDNNTENTSQTVYRRTPKFHRSKKGSLVIAFPLDFFYPQDRSVSLLFSSLYFRYSIVALLASLVSVDVPRLFRPCLFVPRILSQSGIELGISVAYQSP
jgi:hypothetical protein